MATPIECQDHNHQQIMHNAQIPDAELLEELAQTFKIFGDPTRLRVLAALAAGELCVCDIAGLVGASQSNVSHQLRLLRAYRLVKSRREGKGAYYSLDDTHVSSIIEAGLAHLREEEEEHG